jgi:hypothetical protein
MRKNMRLLVFLLNTVCRIFPQEAAGTDFKMSLWPGTFGGGMNVFSNEHGPEFSAGLINVFAEHSKTHIGFEVTPLQYTADYSNALGKWKQNLYFLNGTFYWNPFNIKNVTLGPFVSVNYLSVENWSRFTTDRYVFNSGLRFLWGFPLEKDGGRWKSLMRIIGLETGYRNISGRHGFYFNVNTDVIIAAAGAGVIAVIAAALFVNQKSEVGEANEEYERQINGTGPFVPKEPKPPKPPFQDDKKVK